GCGSTATAPAAASAATAGTTIASRALERPDLMITRGPFHDEESTITDVDFVMFRQSVEPCQWLGVRRDRGFISLGGAPASGQVGGVRPMSWGNQRVRASASWAVSVAGAATALENFAARNQERVDSYRKVFGIAERGDVCGA